MPTLKFKNCDYEFKAVSDEGFIEGYASVFNVIDLGDDLIEKGAFKKTIKETKGRWPILGHHDPRVRLGYNEEAKEDDHGLWFREKLNLDVQAAREQFSLTKMAHDMGGKDGISIGFNIVSAKPDKERPVVRRIKEIQMWEHSHVTFGMNQSAMTTAVKSWLDAESSLGLEEYTDMFFKHMEFVGHDYKTVTEALRAYQEKQNLACPEKKGQDLLSSINRVTTLLQNT